MWCDTLGLPEVGVTQNFFEMGGNSMAALRILGRIRKLKPQADVAIADLFNHQTIRDLATAIERGPRPVAGSSSTCAAPAGGRCSTASPDCW